MTDSWGSASNAKVDPDEEGMYGNFSSSGTSGPAPVQMSSSGGQRPLGSSWGAGPAGSSQGRSGTQENGRPMSSMVGAGFRKATFDPLQEQLRAAAAAPPLEKKTDTSPEAKCLEMERKVNALIEESATLAVKGDLGAALDKAKEAFNKERHLNKRREEFNLSDQVNIDLTYSVHFNLAVQLQRNAQYTEALNTYGVIVRNQQYALSGRLRVNMGNIFAESKKYPVAIKMYGMAIDQIPNTGKEVKFKVMRNIGNIFVLLGQYQEAIKSYEAVMETCPDIYSGFNLLLCYYAVDDHNAMRRQFARLLLIKYAGSSPTGSTSEDDDIDDPDFFISNDNEQVLRQKSALQNDALKQYMRDKRRAHNRLLITAAQFIAPVLDADWQVGYDYVIEQLRHHDRDSSGLSRLAAEMEMAKALEYLKHNKFTKAVDCLKAFEKKDAALKMQASTNLSYLYFLEGDHTNGIKYADMAIEENKFNAKALVNRGNFHFVKGQYNDAKTMYTRALAAEVDCVEAHYNLGLTYKAMNELPAGLECFTKLFGFVHDTVEVIYQIANVLDKMGRRSEAEEWFKTLRTRVPTDPTILARLGAMKSQQDDETEALGYYIEAYRYLPVNLDVISWLGAYFVRIEVYEKAMAFFERAAQIQPQEVKWQLMVANCHRRIGQYPQARRLYEEIHRRHPTNLESLRYLVHICNDTGYKEDAVLWHAKLKKLENKTTGGPMLLDATADKEEEDVDLSDLAELLGQKPAEPAAVEASPHASAAEKRHAAKQQREEEEQKAQKKEAVADDDDLDDMLPT